MSVIHSTRLFKWVPKEIKWMSLNQDATKLAVSRSDNSIEIWNMINASFIEGVITASLSLEDSVEAVVWGSSMPKINQRLFSAGLQGTITEYCSVNLVPKRNYPVTAGSIWCLETSKQGSQIAAGTEHGIVNIFSVTEDGLEMRCTLDRQESKVLSVAWKSDGNFIITGSIDTIRLFSVSNGNCLVRMTTGRSERKQETYVWTLAITDDFSIVTGDSRGKTCFWDGRSGTLETAVDSHKADVLSVALSEDQKTVYSSGVDPVVQQFVRIPARKGSRRSTWVRSVERKTLHAHDVRAMVVAGTHLFSGGTDANLTRSYYPPKVVLKYPSLPSPDSVKVAKESRLILLRGDIHIDIWLLAKPEPVDTTVPGRPIPFMREPIKLAQIDSKNQDIIVTADISEDGKFIAYSTCRELRILYCRFNPKDLRITRIKDISTELVASRQLHLRKNKLISIGYNNTVQIASFSENRVTLTDTIESDDSISWSGGVILSTVSEDGKYLAICDSCGNIIVVDVEKMTLLCKVPRYKALPVAMNINCRAKTFLIVYSDHRIVEFSLEELRYTCFSRELSTRHPVEWLNRHAAARNIFYDPNNEDVVIVYDQTTICTINKQKDLQEPEAKVQRVESSNAIMLPNGDLDSSESSRSSFCPMSPTGQTEHPFVFIRKYEHLVYFGPISSSNLSEFVAVEITPESLELQLPPMLYKKKYGV